MWARQEKIELYNWSKSRGPWSGHAAGWVTHLGTTECRYIAGFNQICKILSSGFTALPTIWSVCFLYWCCLYVLYQLKIMQPECYLFTVLIATNNPSMKGRRGEHTLLSFQLSIEHTVVALTSVMKHRCRVPRFRPGLYSSSDMPPYSSLVSPMNICRRDPSLLRAKSDNAAANTAESQSKPIQSSVWKKKEEKEAKGLAAHLCDSTPQ